MDDVEMVDVVDGQEGPETFEAPAIPRDDGCSLQPATADTLDFPKEYQASDSGESRVSSLSWRPVSPDDPYGTNIQVEVPELPKSEQDQYEELESNVLETIHAELIGSDGGPLFKIELRDGVTKTVSFDEVLQYQNGHHTLKEWNDRSRRARSGSYSEAFTDSESDEEPDVLQLSSEEDARPVRRSTRAQRSRQTSQLRLSDTDEDRKSGGSHRMTRSRGSRQASRLSSGDEDDEPRPSRPPTNRRQLRQRTITSLLPPTHGDDVDELAQSQSSGEESDFLIVKSDLTPAPRKRKQLRKRSKRLKGLARTAGANARSGSPGSDIEMVNPAATRRSGRSTRNQKDMNELALDRMLVQNEERGPGAPRVTTAKEVFQRVPEDSSFAEMHIEYCMTCRNGPNRTLSGGVASGHLLYCQGCSFAYHKPCIGARQARDHLATKIAPDNYVLQCRFCVGSKAKDDRAARPDMCQNCKGVGEACAPFSKKKTARAEEALRKENGGEDPVTRVAPRLVNNADNVLFRCVECKRGWHFEHLPTNQTTSDLENARDARLKEYSGDWKCRECLTYTRKIETLVAWRLAPSVLAQRPQYKSYPLFLAESEDDKEYLVKWESRSYFHCVWMPGAWISGVSQSIVKSAFSKRADKTRDLYKPNEEEAIPDDYLTVDIIFSVKYVKSSHAKTFEEDVARIDDVAKIYVKFVGLSYDQVVWDAPPSKESGKIYDAFKAAYIEYLNGRHFKSESQYNMRARVREFRESKTDDEIQLSDKPESMADDLTLMKYQLQGVNWLLKKYNRGQSGILADEMGLGKTLQVLAFISTLVFSEPRCWPFLVVVPNATCPNWRRETKRFAPKLRIVTYHGGKVAQDLAYRYELFPSGGKELKAHVVVMSYDSAQDEKTWSLFRGIPWAGLVVDEGQRLKNDKNLLYQALRAIKFPFKLLLTGTPVQNNKRELFNLLQFVDKDQDAASLDLEYEDLTDQKLRELHALISPYVLRRTKAQVLKFLPKCENIIVPVTMTSLQKKLYKSILEKSPNLLRAIFSQSKVNKKERGSLNNILMQLRKCLAHPFVYSASIEDEDADDRVMYRHLVDASAKLKLLEIMLPKLYRPTNPDEEPHRVLIFSQFLDQLDVAGEFLEGMGLKHLRLDGTMSSMEKQKRIDMFNQDDTYFAFLLSTRAGGVGINLATADTVIIMDPDFNPHQDLQASCRSHRIGQKRPVLVIQLMTRGSAEEKIMQIGKKKMALDHAVIERMDTAEENEDLEGILRHGADALFGKDEPETIRYTHASVDALLASRPPPKAPKGSPTIQDDDETEQPPQYSYGQVWSNDKGLFELAEAEEDNQISEDTWAAICALREAENARRLQEEQEILGRGGRKRQVVNYRTGTRVNGLEAGVLSESEDDEEYKSQAESDDDESDDGSAASDGGPKPKGTKQGKGPQPASTSAIPVPMPPVENNGRKRKTESEFDKAPKKMRTPETAAAAAAAAAASSAASRPAASKAAFKVAKPNSKQEMERLTPHFNQSLTDAQRQELMARLAQLRQDGTLDDATRAALHTSAIRQIQAAQQASLRASQQQASQHPGLSMRQPVQPATVASQTAAQLNQTAHLQQMRKFLPGVKPSACLLQELRNSPKWPLVEKLLPHLNATSAAVLRQLSKGKDKSNPWWQFLSPNQTAEFDKTYFHLMDMAKIYDVAPLLDRRGRPPGTGSPRAGNPPPATKDNTAVAPTQSKPGAVLQSQSAGHGRPPPEPAPAPRATNGTLSPAIPAVPSPAPIPQRPLAPPAPATSTALSKLSKTEIRVQLDKLKHSNLSPETVAVERKRLKEMLRGVETGGA